MFDLYYLLKSGVAPLLHQATTPIDYNSSEKVYDSNHNHNCNNNTPKKNANDTNYDTSTSSDSNIPMTLTKSTKLYAFCATVNSCNLGYDVGINTNTGKLLQEDMGLSDRQIELFVGSINFWSMFGALAAQYFTDTYGRRKTFQIAAVAFLIGLLIKVAAGTYTILMFGRIFVGLGVGIGLAIDPLYIAEISPAQFRGELVTWSEIALNIGLVLGFSTNLLLWELPIHIQWKIMFLLGTIMPTIMIVLVRFIMPESPRWLVSKNKSEEAEVVLQQVYPKGFNVYAILNDIQDTLDRERRAESTLGWTALLWRPSPATRRMLLVGVLTAVAQQAVGIDAIQYYLLFLLEGSGIESKHTQSIVLIFLGLVKLSFIFVGGKLFDSRGRRPLLFVSLFGMGFSLLVISIIFMSYPNDDDNDNNNNDDTISTNIIGSASFIIVISLASYLAFFSIGMGPGAWLIPSEIFSVCIRAKAISIATLCNRLMSTFMSSTFLSLEKIFSWGGFFLCLVVVCIAVLLFLYCYLPETKNRSLEDMSRYFAEITRDRTILETEGKIVMIHPNNNNGEGHYNHRGDQDEVDDSDGKQKQQLKHQDQQHTIL